MRVFVSWSGERSKVVATSLNAWLPDVFQDLVTWMSAHSIDAGQRWGHELGEQLESATFGILCLTPENLGAPWLLFEAGALSKVIGQARVVPYLFQLSGTDVPFPLAQFQGVEASEAGTLNLVKSINASLERSIPADRLDRLFEKWWPDLKEKLASVPAAVGAPSPQRSERALLEEILQTVRSLSQVASPSHPTTDYDVDYWRGVAIWNISQKYMEALTLDELLEFRNQASAAASAAFPISKDDAISAKVALADQEISKRRKGHNSTAPAD